ncbi:hypothetical protein H4N64_44280, partial [Streptomyces sp. PSKA01]|nr:hypothetical protein [Streptomyces cupreus]
EDRLCVEKATNEPLHSLAKDLPPAKRALAEALRVLFSYLDIPLRRYSVRRHRDPGTVSRYLSGQRMPPADFVTKLVEDAHEHGAPLNAADGAHLRKLLEEALREQGGDAAQIAILGLQLDEKDKESRAAKQKAKE